MNATASIAAPRRARQPLLLVALLALAACIGPSVTSVAIEGGDRTLAVDDPIALTAVVVGGPPSVAWTSTDPSVAAVDGAGTVTGLAAGTTTVRATSTAAASARGEITVTVVPQGEVHWTRQFGTASDDRAYAAAIDATGRVVVAGSTAGALEGTNAGEADAYVRVYAADGTSALWTRQFGTAGSEYAYGVATDPTGAVVVTGSTTGALEGANLGLEDVFVRAYDGDGTERWTRQFGTASCDTGYAVAATHDSRVVVVGSTSGALEGTGAGAVDGFVRVFDGAGDLRWTRQFGTPAADFALGLAVATDGRVLVAGPTTGDLGAPNAGGFDAFLRAYDADGTFLWGAQFGTPADEQVGQVAIDGAGNVFVVGETDGDLGAPNQGLSDGFVRKFAGTGATRWTRQFGTPASESVATAAADGRIAVVGHTAGDLGGPNAGSNDGFVRVYGP